MSERPVCPNCGASVHVFGQYCSAKCKEADMRDTAEKGWLKPILEDIRADIKARPDWQKNRVRSAKRETAESPQPSSEKCYQCGTLLLSQISRGCFYLSAANGRPHFHECPGFNSFLQSQQSANGVKQMLNLGMEPAEPAPPAAPLDMKEILARECEKHAEDVRELARLEAENAALRFHLTHLFTHLSISRATGNLKCAECDGAEAALATGNTQKSVESRGRERAL